MSRLNQPNAPVRRCLLLEQCGWRTGLGTKIVEEALMALAGIELLPEEAPAQVFRPTAFQPYLDVGM